MSHGRFPLNVRFWENFETFCWILTYQVAKPPRSLEIQLWCMVLLLLYSRMEDIALKNLDFLKQSNNIVLEQKNYPTFGVEYLGRHKLFLFSIPGDCRKGLYAPGVQVALSWRWYICLSVFDFSAQSRFLDIKWLRRGIRLVTPLLNFVPTPIISLTVILVHYQVRLGWFNLG